MVQVFGFRVYGLGYWGDSLGFRVYDIEFIDISLLYMDYGLGFRV